MLVMIIVFIIKSEQLNVQPLLDATRCLRYQSAEVTEHFLCFYALTMLVHILQFGKKSKITLWKTWRCTACGISHIRSHFPFLFPEAESCFHPTMPWIIPSVIPALTMQRFAVLRLPIFPPSLKWRKNISRSNIQYNGFGIVWIV